MIAKYPGACRYCRKLIEVGRDEYDVDSKTSFHVGCAPKEQPPSSDRLDLADRLGFVLSEDVMDVAWSRMRFLSPRNRNRSIESIRSDDAPRGLFGAVRPMSAGEER